MRPSAAPLAVAALLALAVLAPVATAVEAAPAPAGPYPPPLCIICVIVTQIVIPCVAAEANQDVFDNGDGCVIVNNAQHAVDCLVRSVEAQLGLGQPCPA
jgi:hypothetical protein